MTHEPSPVPFSWSARARSFLYAARGLRILVASQHNARLHVAATIIVIVLGGAFGLTRYEWLAIVTAIGLVWIAETTNTAIERLGDAVTREPHPFVRDAKDLAAGAVLAAAATAATLGLLVFVPYVFALFIRLGLAA
jgi:diacylglycerol kinase (ATP)